MAPRGRPRKIVEMAEPVDDSPAIDATETDYDAMDEVVVRILWEHVGIRHGETAYRDDEIAVQRDVAELLVSQGSAAYA